MISLWVLLPCVVFIINALFIMHRKDKLLEEKDKLIEELSQPKIKLEPDEVCTITITKIGTPYREVVK